MSAVGDARKRLTKAAAPDAVTDVEALARVMCEDDHRNCGYAAWDAAPEGIRGYHRDHAETILASDWLAAHVAALIAAAEARGAAEERERIASSIEADWMAGRLLDFADAARIARASDLIERSSLGTPEAKALRATVSDEHAAHIVARARALEAEDAARAAAQQAATRGQGDADA
jgi:hypothetical protein